MKFTKSLLFIIIALIVAYFGKQIYMQPKVVNGEDAPTIAGQLMNGETFDLKDLKGKYVLVDFWGSWCGPCMVEMPGIKMLNEKYKKAQFSNAEGLTVLSVAIEKDEKRWRRAVDRIGMPWKYHMADLTTNFKFINSPIAAEFGVKQVPSKFLLDENGIIIGVNQSIEELDKFLTKRLK